MTNDVAISAKVQGLEDLTAKLLKLGGPVFEEKLRAANAKNAEEFAALVKSIIPRGTEDSHLADSIVIAQSGRVGTAVSIGDAAHKYPMHLETGHRNKGGEHVPGKPFWYPAKRVQSRRWRGRTRRVGNAMIKTIAAGMASGGGD
jgi:hypothetical protein